MKDSRIAGLFNNTVRILFIILMTVIVAATVFIDRKVSGDAFNASFLTTVTHANIWYYLAAALIGAGVIYILLKTPSLSDRGFYFASLIVVMLVFIWQCFVARWLPADISGVDFGTIKLAAIDLAYGGGRLSEYGYFSASPNNANMAIFLAILYRLVPHWTAIIILGALSTNFAALFVSLTVRNYTKNNKTALLLLFASEILLGMNWRAFLVYTDNFGMLFVAAALWLGSLDITYKVKVPLVTAAITIACFIKVTNFILFMAFGIYFLLNCTQNHMEYFKRVVYAIICFGVIFSLQIGARNILRDHYGFAASEKAKDWRYLFMVGQNVDSYGTVNNIDPGIREDFLDMYETAAEAKHAMFAEGIRRVKERGLSGNVSFFFHKLDVAYGDGYFHNVQNAGADWDNSFLANVYKRGGSYYWVMATILQIIWDAALLCLLVGGGLYQKKDRILGLYYLVIGAVTVYLMCFEGRSKYIFMFLPVYMIAAGLSFEMLAKKIR
ncbi:MAG: hypothetical protein K2O32_02705 [Acetatifactor sp.]|nr:hypothetical protein [Acetatifactor sp.]